MTEQEQLLQDAAFEIKKLRNQNEKMLLRLNMFDSVMSIFNADKPQCNGGMSPDIVFAIEKYLQSQKQ